MDVWQYEKELYTKGLKYIGGIDEVGRGPLNGPVVTACVILPPDFVLDGLTDSKKLTERKRELYCKYIKEHAIAWAIGQCSAEEIDKYNILEATKIAMQRALTKVQKKIRVDHVLIDGNMTLSLNIPYTSIVKGDSKSISISAASVLAKVTRDHMMIELDKKYPMYGYKDHKGYPTKKHLEAIAKYGIIAGYRKSYGPVKKIIEKNNLEGERYE